MNNHTDLQPGDLVTPEGESTPVWEIVGPADSGFPEHYKFKIVGEDTVHEKGSFSITWPVTRAAGEPQTWSKISPDDLKSAGVMADHLQALIDSADESQWFVDLSEVVLPFKNGHGYQIGTFSFEDGTAWFTPDYKED